MARTPLTARESTRRTVTRLTRILAAVAVAATAAFAGAAASVTRHHATADGPTAVDSGDASASSFADGESSGDGYDDDEFGFGSTGQAPSFAGGTASAVTGGS